MTQALCPSPVDQWFLARAVTLCSALHQRSSATADHRHASPASRSAVVATGVQASVYAGSAVGVSCGACATRMHCTAGSLRFLNLYSPCLQGTLVGRQSKLAAPVTSRIRLQHGVIAAMHASCLCLADFASGQSRGRLGKLCMSMAYSGRRRAAPTQSDGAPCQLLLTQHMARRAFAAIANAGHPLNTVGRSFTAFTLRNVAAPFPHLLAASRTHSQGCAGC